jgi:beta-glucosidase
MGLGAWSKAYLACLAAIPCALSCSSKGDDAQPSNDAGADVAVDSGPACGPGASIPKYVREGGTAVDLPKTFLFGAASAGMQIEKGLVHADWYQWANLPGKIQNDQKPDDGPDAFAHFDDDVKALVDAGANSYRFSIEWSRIYPTKAAFDADTPDAGALTTYHSLLAKLKAAGIRPFVTLHHFATPDYFDDITKPAEPQTFERDEFKTAFATFARRMGKEFGAEVDDWITINEHLILLLGSYGVRKHPPGALLDLDRLFAAAKKLLYVHAAAYDALHEGDTVDAGTGNKAFVSMAAHNRVFYPRDACEEQDVAAAEHTDYIWNQWTYNALVFGDFDADLDGKYDGPSDKKSDPLLKGKVDWLGLNYYGNTVISAEVKLPYIGGLPTYEGMPTDLPKTDMNWDIFPQGFRPILKQLAKYKLPIYITENGIGDQQDKNKARYLAEHLWEVGRAIRDDGVDVRGYFFWSLTDNFEWDHGFCPRFGLFRVDYTTPARTRSPTAAVAVYHRIATEKKVTAEAIDALPAYSPPVLCAAP